jgi:hypothetical protein
VISGWRGSAFGVAVANYISIGAPNTDYRHTIEARKVELAVGAGPLILEVMAVMDAPVCVAETELDVEFEVVVALADVVFAIASAIVSSCRREMAKHQHW